MRRARLILYTTAGWLVLHGIIWLWVAQREPSSYPWPKDVRSMLEYWDAWHYSAIATKGYAGPVRWAFYPLYPLLVRALAWLTGLRARPDIVGTVFSTLAFAAYCLTQARLAKSTDERLRGLRPETIWGWLFFLCWPASWVFHSHHTESLFLLLSFLAFLRARDGRWRTAAVLAGLCALTRNQGVFVAVAVALESALQQQRGWLRRAFIFGASGLISGLLFSLWPLYQYWAAGSPLMFVRAQWQFFPPVTSVYNYVGTIWFANYWQHPTGNFYLHHLAFVLLNVLGGMLLYERKLALGLYVLLSLWGPLYLGHLENAYRYGAVLFPALFLLGDRTQRWPWPLRLALLGGLIYLNLTCTRAYALGAWAY
ncbi:MAG: mannosyltransferase family protein [Pyrinomonadaceae bacterium]